MKYIYLILNVIFFSKKIFSKPKQKDFLIVNGDHADIILKYLKNTDTNVVYNRFTRGIEKNSVINFFVLYLIFLKFKFSTREYVKEFIKLSKPKILITLIDNDAFFYELGNSSSYTSILIQNSYRSTQLDVFGQLENLKKNKNLYCDYILTFNEHVGKLYKSFLKGKIVQIGSFRSNSVKRLSTVKKYDILFISSYKGHSNTEHYIKEHNVTWGDTRVGEEIIINHLKKFIKKNSHLKLFILGCKVSSKEKEKKYWSKRLKGIEYTFIPQSLKRETYKIIDQTKVLISIDSSLGYESIARGNKICVFSVRPNKYPTDSSKFGWPQKLKEKGFFWTNSLEYEDFDRVLSNTYSISETEYFKTKTQNIKKSVIIFSNILNFHKIFNYF